MVTQDLVRAEEVVEAKAAELQRCEETLSTLETTINAFSRQDRRVFADLWRPQLLKLIEERQLSLSAYHEAVRIRDAAKNRVG